MPENIFEQVFSITNIIIYVAIINLITFLAFWIDKRKAEHGKWRIKENTLLALVILGGGMGGIVGMYTFRHKTQKARFFLGFPVILIAQIILVILFLT